MRLQQAGIQYEREVEIKVQYSGEPLGTFLADFIVADKILLELKHVWRLTQDDIQQVLRYLKATKLRLGILVNFKRHRLQYYRIVN